MRVLAFLILAGCASPTLEAQLYQPPEADGLISVRPYPSVEDVCQVIGENALTNQHLGDASLLIGCPSVEFGAIADRQAEGAVVVDQIGRWTLLSVPLG